MVMNPYDRVKDKFKCTHQGLCTFGGFNTEKRLSVEFITLLIQFRM
jgi:hypothetical protein